MSSFYSTNNKKFAAYKVSRRKEQEYQEDQQDQIDEMLAEQRGDIVAAQRYARLAKNVFNQFGEEVMKPSTKMATTGMPAATDYIKQLIERGTLSQWFDKLKNADLKGLSKKARIIVSDIQNPEIRKQMVEAFNDQIAQANTTEEKQKAVEDIIFGGDKNVAAEVLLKTNAELAQQMINEKMGAQSAPPKSGSSKSGSSDSANSDDPTDILSSIQAGEKNISWDQFKGIDASSLELLAKSDPDIKNKPDLQKSKFAYKNDKGKSKLAFSKWKSAVYNELKSIGRVI